MKKADSDVHFLDYFHVFLLIVSLLEIAAPSRRYSRHDLTG